MNDIEIVLEDLDTLVEIARQHTGIASWLGLVQSALIMKEALEKQLSSGWIPVSERLPENNTKVLVTGREYSEYLKKYRYVRFIAKHISKNSVKVDDMWSYCECDDLQVYDEDEDEYCVKEGWYESVENWDDYSDLYVSDYIVIAWQPLPEPYKEVENE